MVVFVTVTKSERPSIIQNGHCIVAREQPHERASQRKEKDGKPGYDNMQDDLNKQYISIQN